MAAVLFVPAARDSFESPKLVAVGALTLFAIGRDKLEIPRSLIAPIVLWLAALGIGTIFSVAPITSVFGSSIRADGLATQFLFVALFVVSSTLARTDYVELAIVAGASVAGTYGVAQALGHDPLPWVIGPEFGNAALSHRAFGTLANPSFLGMQCAIALPIVLSIFQKWGNSTLLFCLPLVGGLFASESRAAAVAAVIALGFLAARSTGRSRGVGAALTVALLVGTITSPLGSRLRQTNPTAGTEDVRRQLAETAIRAIAARPVTGYGPGTFQHVLDRTASSDVSPAVRQNPSSHNPILDTGIAAGVLGIAGLFGLVLVIAPTAWRDPSAMSSLLAAAIACSVGFFGVAAAATVSIVAGMAFRDLPKQPIHRAWITLVVFAELLAAWAAFALR